MACWSGRLRRVSRAVPDEAPTPLLVRVADVLEAFRAAGRHGTTWFEVEDVDVRSWLPGCSSPATCASVGGLDLGEVSLDVVGPVEWDQPVRSAALVESVSFRKPSGTAALRATCALTSLAEPLLVFDDSGDRMFVVGPQERCARRRFTRERRSLCCCTPDGRRIPWLPPTAHPTTPAIRRNGRRGSRSSVDPAGPERANGRGVSYTASASGRSPDRFANMAGPSSASNSTASRRHSGRSPAALMRARFDDGRPRDRTFVITR
jgi:hypothetical protein